MRSRPTRRAHPAARHTAWFRLTTAAGSAAMLSTLGLAGTSLTATHAATSAASAARIKLVDDSASCHLGNGIQHVVQLTFDNVHFFRDNPNVPSDLELMPNLLNFFENNGTILSNNHTPLIAHTADDILTTYSGLYGDRQGDGIANDYQSYNTERPERDVRHQRLRHRVHLLDRLDRRQRHAEHRGRHQPEHGLLVGPAGHRVRAR